MAQAIASLTPSDPTEQFYAVRDWDSRIVKAQRQAQGLAWDPWPVKHSFDTFVFAAAQTVVLSHNARCITCSQHITLLPASGNYPNLQGGSWDRRLYSIRSPSALPIKVHIWQTPGAKVMASKGLQTAALTTILASFGSLRNDTLKPCDICKHYRCWKSRSISKKWLQYVPTQLHQTIRERWWAFNGFPFLSLPFELREMILILNIGSLVEPLRRLNMNPLRRLKAVRPHFSNPNLSLASVSKQLHGEVMMALCLKTTFYFCDPASFLGFYSFATPGIAVPSLEGVRCMEFDFSLVHLCGVFDIPRDARVGHSAQGAGTTAVGDLFRACITKLHLRRVHVKFPPASYNWAESGCNITICQKTFCLRVWAGIRVLLRDVPVIELGGHIDEQQRQQWLQELRLENRGVVPDLKELKEWQTRIWEQ